jgi:sugar lactone lactonase YvrE
MAINIAAVERVDVIDGVDCAVGESPVWSAADAAWYWVDIPAKTIWRLDPASGALVRWQCAEMVACIAAREGGGLIAGMESGIFGLTLGDDGTAVPLRLAAPPPAELQPGMRFNDGRCDRQGRFWSGTMLMDMAAARPDGHLYRYTAQDGLSEAIVSGLLVQNGLAWSPDGTTMYLSDSHPARQLVWTFDYDTDEGMPHNRRLFIDMNGYPGRPDGAAVDSDGCYWTCGNDEGCILRFTPAGKLDRKVAVPMPKPSMCSFGGPGLDTMLVTSIGAGKAEGDAWAGKVLMLRPGATGVAETPFRG